MLVITKALESWAITFKNQALVFNIDRKVFEISRRKRSWKEIWTNPKADRVQSIFGVFIFPA